MKTPGPPLLPPLGWNPLVTLVTSDLSLAGSDHAQELQWSPTQHVQPFLYSDSLNSHP